MNQFLTRRHVLAATAAWAAQAMAADPAAGRLPQAQSLPDELALALRRKQPLVAMVSLDGCVFCKAARQSHLLPMHREGAVVVQLDMRSQQPVRDWDGRMTTHAARIAQWRVGVAPTLLFLGPGGREVAPRMEGAYLPDFYAAYLEDRMVQGARALAGG